jgi:hypothetical protein
VPLQLSLISFNSFRIRTIALSGKVEKLEK